MYIHIYIYRSQWTQRLTFTSGPGARKLDQYACGKSALNALEILQTLSALNQLNPHKPP